MLPRGHGLFVRSWRVTSRGVNSPRTFASVYRAAHFSFASPVVLAGNTRSKLRESQYWAAARAAGIEMHPCWVLPEPSASIDDICARLCESVARLGARSLIVDPELEYKGKRREAMLLAASMEQRTRQHGLLYGFTSYSLPNAHPDFPWAEFAGADFAFAQTYDARMLFEPDYFARAVSQYRDKGFRVSFPCFGLNDRNANRTKPVPDLRRHLRLIPTDADAVCGWGPPTVPTRQWGALASWNSGTVPRGGLGGMAPLVLGGLTLAGLALAALKG